jgi:hypothetical protein
MLLSYLHSIAAMSSFELALHLSAIALVYAVSAVAFISLRVISHR